MTLVMSEDKLDNLVQGFLVCFFCLFVFLKSFETKSLSAVQIVLEIAL